MIGTDTISRVIGKDVYDESGDKIGSASEVYLDDETGQPEWVTVRTGLFGTKESFVPIRDADLENDGLRVRVSKAKVKDAPKIDTDGHLSPQEEQELYRYYGLGSGGTNTQTETTRTEGLADAHSGVDTGMVGTERAGQTSGTVGNTVGGEGFTDTSRSEGHTDTASGTDTGREESLTTGRGPVGRDVSGPTTDEAMTRSEERLNVGTRSEEVGRARLRKYVVSENVTETVPVSHEEVRLEREPITDANAGAALDGPSISEEEHEVTLHAERPVVEKEAVPVERVRLDTETVTEQARVSEDVRREEIEMEGAEGTGVRGTTDTTRGTSQGDDRGLAQKAKDALDRDNDGKIG